jgi:shikimate kinase
VLQNRDARVIALGGGTWTIPANRKLIALHDCATVWIDAPFDLCWYRITGSTNTVRPLAPNWASARKLYAARRASYQLAQLRVEAHKKKKSRQMVSEITAAFIVLTERGGAKSQRPAECRIKTSKSSVSRTW